MGLRRSSPSSDDWLPPAARIPLPAGGEPLARHTSLRVGGPARHFASGGDAVILSRALAAAHERGIPTLTLGGGSNLLVADGGFDGLVVKYTATDYTVRPVPGEADGDGAGEVIASGGVAIANLSRQLARDGWSGLEWASNVPGTAGGAAVNNAGAFGSSIADGLIDLDLLDASGTRRTLGVADLGYAYRSSILKRSELGPVLVTSVRYRLRRDDPGATRARIVHYQAQRTATQPRQLSAGSVFANPPADFAGRLLDEAGLKGTRRGEAEISTQHANFIVNAGHATATDVYALVRLAQDRVWRRFGVWLRPEIQLVGTWTPAQLALLAEAPSAGEVPS